MQIPQPVQLAQPQSYLDSSKPITPYEGDKSKGIALSGEANILESAVQSADMLVKEKISMDVHAGVDARRDAEINSLATLRDAATGTPAANDPNAKTYDLFAQNKPVYDGTNGGQPPAALQGISSVANNLKSALVGGHIPLTYYRQQMDSFAKDMRSMYGPGYRPYVDEQFKQAGAGDTANEYMQALVSDLNKIGGKTQAASERMDKRLEEANDKGIPGVPSLIAGRKQGVFSDDYVNKQLNTFSADHYQREVAKERYAVSEAGTKWESVQAEQDLSKELFSISGTHWSSVLGASKILSTSDLAQKAAEARANPGMYKPEQYETWAQMTLANKDEALKAMDAKANEPFGPDQRSFIQRLGTGGAEKYKQIRSVQADSFDRVYNAFKSKDFGLAMDIAQKNQHILEGSTNRYFNDPDWGPTAQVLATADKQGGPAVAGILLSKALENGSLSKFNGYLSKEMVRSATAPEAGGTRKTMADVMKEVGDHDDTKNPDLPKAFINHVTNITDKNLPDTAKVNIIKWAFDPANRGTLRTIAPDRYDPATGQTVKGQAWMFQTMTNPANTAEIRRLSQQDPTLWKNYKDWATESFGFQQLSSELKTVNDNIDQNVSMRWYNGHIELLGSKPAIPHTGYRGNVNPSAQAAVDRINGSLDNLKNVFAAENPDPKAVDAYLIRTLNDLGVDPNRKPPPGTPIAPKEILDKMWSAIATTAQKAGKAIVTPNPKLGQPIDDKIQNYSEEAQKVSLQDWLKNPDMASTPTQLPQREAVPPGKKWWGDAEAEAAGLYEPSKKPKK